MMRLVSTGTLFDIIDQMTDNLGAADYRGLYVLAMIITRFSCFASYQRAEISKAGTFIR